MAKRSDMVFEVSGRMFPVPDSTFDERIADVIWPIIDIELEHPTAETECRVQLFAVLEPVVKLEPVAVKTALTIPDFRPWV